MGGNIDPVSMGKYGYERISSGLAPVVDPFPRTDLRGLWPS